MQLHVWSLLELTEHERSFRWSTTCTVAECFSTLLERSDNPQVLYGFTQHSKQVFLFYKIQIRVAIIFDTKDKIESVPISCVLSLLTSYAYIHYVHKFVITVTIGLSKVAYKNGNMKDVAIIVCCISSCANIHQPSAEWHHHPYMFDLFYCHHLQSSLLPSIALISNSKHFILLLQNLLSFDSNKPSCKSIHYYSNVLFFLGISSINCSRKF